MVAVTLSEILCRPAARSASQNVFDIVNNVKHIEDYMAPVIGEFELLVLISLLRLGNGAYGAAIRRDISERTIREVSIGTVYMTLGAARGKRIDLFCTSATRRRSAAAAGASTI